MKYVYYDVYDNTPGLDDRHNECTYSEIIGRWQKYDSAIAQMKDWVASVGLPDFESCFYEVERKYIEDDDDQTLMAVAGTFYSCNDNEVPFTRDWAYGRYVSVYKIEIELDINFTK